MSTLFLSTLFLSTLFLSTVSAVEIEPLRVEVSGQPGHTVTGALHVTNHRSEPVVVVAHMGEYRYAFTAHTKLPSDPALQRLPPCHNWVTMSPSELPLGPGQAGSVTFTVQMPEAAAHAPAGEYVAAILLDEHAGVSAAPEAAAAGGGVITILPRIAVPFYLFVEGRETPRGRIAAVTAAAGPAPHVVRFLVTLANDGQVHLRPTGTILITNDRREVVQRIPLGRTIPIFPKFQEEIPVLVPLDPGRYHAVVTVDLGGADLLQQALTLTVTADGLVQQGR